MEQPPVQPGAEPMSATGSDTGVLVVHGFTGSPQSMRPIAQACADAGYTVEMPRLPGHGTSVADMHTTSWADWSAHVEATYLDLAARVSKVFVVGLSMGGALSLWLASLHPEVAGIVLINSAGQPSPEMAAGIDDMLGQGLTEMDAVGNDIAKAGVVELAYDTTPLAPLKSLLEAVDAFDLSAVTSPALILVSEQDHVVPPETADYIVSNLGSPARVVPLTRSYHVATLDHDADLIIEETLAFIG